MTTQISTAPNWIASSLSEATYPSLPELSALAEHLKHCRNSKGRWFSLRCAAETMDGFIAGRFITTLALMTLVLGISVLVFS